MVKPAATISVPAAMRHYAQVDPRLHTCVTALLDIAPPLVIPEAKPVQHYFSTLVRSIVGQQISTKAATAIYETLANNYSIQPAVLANVPADELQSSGLTKQKTRYIQALAKKWSQLDVAEFPTLTDEAITARLTACYGIGAWTAQMFLLFAMSRPDVFAIGDLGLRQQVARWYQIDVCDLVTIRTITDRWSPHRSLAVLALWFAIDNGPVLF